MRRADVLLSMQRALLGCVTTALREVAVSWDDHRIAARFTYDREDSDHTELVAEIETQVYADFEPVETDFTIEVVPEPTPVAVLDREVLVYSRGRVPDESSADDVRMFFAFAGGADLLLPDGWFGGRPMENFHQLTFVTARPKRLVIELDDHLLLSFSGTPEVKRAISPLGTDKAIVIRGFRQCVLEYLEYGGDEAPHVRSYDGGDVWLVAS